LSRSRGREVTVLVVDDHAAMRKFLTVLLEGRGLHVAGQAANGREAVSLCEQLHPQIVVLDISMPLLNGFEAARRIMDLSFPTKIIFLTGERVTKEYVEEAFRVGGAAFVSKDHAVHDLLEAIDVVLDGQTYISGGSAA
jgi:DNA-binding NarL/FixJ family response regulator